VHSFLHPPTKIRSLEEFEREKSSRGPELNKMWKRLSLRSRLFLPMVMMVMAALVLGGLALRTVSPDQFESENAAQSRSAKVVADALNAVLAVSTNPEQTLDVFVRGLGPSEAMAFRRAEATWSRPPVRAMADAVPDWFIRLLNIPELGTSYPIMIGNNHVGDIIFTPDLSADIFEKWVGFLVVVSSGSALMLLAGLCAYFTAGAALRPLEQLGAGLTRMRQGNFDTRIAVAGPPEIRRSCQATNELASRLKQLSQDNRNLLRKIVSLQDDERHELARELHDELGPLLFAIRANATVLAETVNDRDAQPGPSAQGILQAAEALQQVNRRILEGLSPLYVQDLGLEQSIQTLLRTAQSQAPNVKLTSKIDRRLNDIDGLLSQTAYRVIQEGVTNVLRHAQATAMDVDAAVAEREVAIEISDDGIGLPPESAFGRGLTGMHERVRALNGTFELFRDKGRTFIRCRLPLEQAAND
jgi:two-component system sensor histidine kinase UhpB